MPATQVGVVQMESAQSMVDGPLKNKIVILMSWNYWQLSFAFTLSATDFCIMSDNATAISYIKHMGGTKYMYVNSCPGT